MRKIFTMVLATVAATTMAFAAVQETTQSVDCGTSKTIVATPATGYHFVRWEKDGSAIAGDATLTISDISADATYEAIFAINTYTIRFMNGTEVLQSFTVEHGQTPSYTGAEPTKNQDAQYTYAFSGWSPAVAAATADQDYVAQFTPTLRSYTITFKNYNGETLQSGLVAYGETPVYSGETPTKPSDAENDYVFAGWDMAIASVTGEATYTATFTTVPKTFYTITEGVNPTGTGHITGVGSYENGTVVTLTAVSDDDCYVFDHWADDNSTNASRQVTVTGNVTYTAVFTKIPYSITIKSGDDNKGTVSFQ